MTHTIMTNSLRPKTLCLLAVALALSSFSLVGCKKAADDTEKPEAIVQAAHPTTGSITEDISADATLTPIAQAAILPKITAPIKQFYVQRGSHVAAGQLLATLENSDLSAAVADSNGTYEAAKAAYTTSTQGTIPEDQTRASLDVKQAAATLDFDNRVLFSRQQLFARGAMPGRDVDTAKATAQQAQAAYDIAKQRFDTLTKTGTSASIENAKGQLASAEGKYLGAKAQLSYTSIRTPIAGVVTDRPLFAGETAAPGAPIITVMDTSSLIAKLHLAQAQAQRLSIGSPASLTVPGIDEPVAAKVSLISPALDPGSTTVEVWLRVPNKDGKLKAGTSLHATLAGRTITDAMLVPTDAVQRSTEGAGKFVLVMAADGTAKKRTVTVGIQTAETTQVLDGLKPTDTVITGGGYGLDDGTKVKIGPAEAKDADDEKPSAGKKADPAGTDSKTDKDDADDKKAGAKP